MSTRRLLWLALAVSLVLAGVVSGWASGHPDGLEHVAATHGFADAAGTSLTAGSPLADYPGGWSGVVGCALVFTVVALVMRVGTRFTQR